MSTLHQIIADLLSAIKNTNASLEALKLDRAEIKDKYDPVKLARAQFNSWRDSNDGKIFKKKLYKKQERKCASPTCKMLGHEFHIDYFEIDHKLPVSSYPHLALDKSNMHLLCTPCNKRKSKKF